MKITIESYLTSNATEITDLHHASVHAIDPCIYTLEQQEAWAHTPPNYPYWEKRLALKKPFLARVEERIIGFIELEESGQIDCAYTHPNFQKCGVMRKLYAHLESVAKQKGMKRLYLEASSVAKTFFEKQGFVMLHPNEIKKNGCMLVNYSMEKKIG